LITFEHLQVAITCSIQELGNLITSCTDNEFLFCLSHQNLIIPNNHIAIATSTGLITQTQTQKLQDRNHIMKQKKKKKMMMPKKSLELALRGFKVLVVACFRNPGIQELGF
jgi:hypothetical protein